MLQELESPILNQVLQALSKYWGFDTLRPVQGEVVEAALNNRDAVVVMPTGGGKSLCFQLPAVVTQTLTVVISPLIALMKDQVDALTVVGVPAAVLNSSLSFEEDEEVRHKVLAGHLRLLYISPERLLQPATLQLLQNADGGRGVGRFAIDEAHCISAWGHDFRPEYRQMRRIKEVFPGVPVLAFTATATPRVQKDIAIQLNLEKPRRFVGVFDRPNLTYRVVAKDDAVRRTVEAVRRYPDEGVIVYCLSRKDTEAIAGALQANNIPAVAYHAGLPPDVRKQVSEDFAQEKANVVVATVAFGMGIDRANVRCVIHECLPKSMEGYQQETGRAGRDGLPSECVLLYSHGDTVRLQRLISGDSSTSAHHTQLLEEVRRFATSHQCRHKSLSEYFGQTYELDESGCGACDVCLGGTQRVANASEVGSQILRTADFLLRVGGGRSFGVAFLVSVLTGSNAKAVLERQGEKAEGFGAFAHEDKERVTSWVYQMMDLGLLQVSSGQYPVVSITDQGRAALADGTDIVLIENVALLMPAKSKTTIENVDLTLFENLRQWRRAVAAERGVPAYVILSDATLMRISASRPSTRKGLGSLPGVGERQAEEFGDQLVALVATHAAETGVPLDQPLVTTKTASAPSASNSTYTPYFQAGLSVEEICAKTGRQPSTVYTHLATWIEVERPESIASWVDQPTVEQVAAAIDAVDSEYLKPVYEKLEGVVDYGIIRIVKAFLKPPTTD